MSRNKDTLGQIFCNPKMKQPAIITRLSRSGIASNPSDGALIEGKFYQTKLGTKNKIKKDKKRIEAASPNLADYQPGNFPNQEGYVRAYRKSTKVDQTARKINQEWDRLADSKRD